MQHTKFRENRPVGSGEEDFLVVRRPSWSCDLNFGITLSLPLPRDAPQNFSLIGNAVSEKKI